MLTSPHRRRADLLGGMDADALCVRSFYFILINFNMLFIQIKWINACSNSSTIIFKFFFIQ